MVSKSPWQGDLGFAGGRFRNLRSLEGAGDHSLAQVTPHTETTALAVLWARFERIHKASLCEE